MTTADKTNHSAVPGDELGIRAFPTQADAAYWVIVVVLLVVFTGGLVGESPVCMLPVAITMLVLPIRAVLSSPERELAAQDLKATERLQETGAYQRLQASIDDLGREIGVSRLIKLVISKEPNEARAFGSWRRHFILLGSEVARQLDLDLRHEAHREKARALLAHEIAHLHHRDVQHIGYTRELLRSCFVILPWWGLFLTGWLGFAFLSVDALLAFDAHDLVALDPALLSSVSPALDVLLDQKVEIAEKTQSVSFRLVMNFLVTALWPILFIGFVLWLFYWRRMIRLQEFYADNLTLEITNSEESLLKAFGRYPAWVRLAGSENSLGVHIRALARELSFSFEEQLFRLSSTVYEQWHFSRNRISRWFDLHPTYVERLRSLRDPIIVQNDWRGVAGSVAVLVLSLNVLLISPMATYHSLGNPIYLATIATFVMLSTWVLPFIVNKQPLLRQLVKVLAVVFVLRAIFVVVDRFAVILLAIAAPTVAVEFLNSLLLAIARYSRPITTPPVTDPLELMLQSIPIYLLLQLLLPLLTVAALLGSYYLLVSKLWPADLSHRLAEDPSGWHHRHWVAVSTLSVMAVTLFMVPVVELVSGPLAHLWAPGNLTLYGLGLGSFLFLLTYSFRQRRQIVSQSESNYA